MSDNIWIFDHPLIQDKVAKLRNIETDTDVFRKLIEEITMLMVFESLRDLPLIEADVTTPLETVKQNMLPKGIICAVPILRAGLGMLNGLHAIVPYASVGHIGIYRNEKTLQPIEYYCKLPKGIENKICILLDPMLATGGSASAAVALLKSKGAKDIRLMSIIAVQNGIDKVHYDHPDVKIFVASKDRQLNEDGYILPGLGDAGDRIFGTK